MPRDPLVSVVIPTRNRAAALTACLQRLEPQSLGLDNFEVIVVHDGDDPEGRAAAGPFAGRLNLTDLTAPRLGVAHARNEAIAGARGGMLLLLNDDVLPAPDLLEAHLSAHARRGPDQPPALVVGHSPFVAPPPDRDTLFDRLLRQTSAVFFYDRMTAGDPAPPPDHDWGFRHAWTLNLSLPRSLADAVGGFHPAIANACYEDIEFAWRCVHHAGSPVLFCPRALAPHDHRLSPDGYLAREWRLGYSSLGFARASARCAREVFGRDLPEAEPWYAEAFVQREGRDEHRYLVPFRAAAAAPASIADGPHGGTILDLLYAQHLPLKRLAFRRGLLDALKNRRFPGLFHPSDPALSRPVPRPRTAA